MDTIYEGDAVRNFVKRLMLSTRKTTYRNQWLNMYTAHWDHNYKVSNLMKSAALLAIDFYYYGPKFKQWLDKNMSWLCCLEYVILASAVVAYVFAVFLWTFCPSKKGPTLGYIICFPVIAYLKFMRWLFVQLCLDCIAINWPIVQKIKCKFRSSQLEDIEAEEQCDQSTAWIIQNGFPVQVRLSILRERQGYSYRIVCYKVLPCDFRAFIAICLLCI